VAIRGVGGGPKRAGAGEHWVPTIIKGQGRPADQVRWQAQGGRRPEKVQTPRKGPDEHHDQGVAPAPPSTAPGATMTTWFGACARAGKKGGRWGPPTVRERKGGSEEKGCSSARPAGGGLLDFRGIAILKVPPFAGLDEPSRRRNPSSRASCGSRGQGGPTSGGAGRGPHAAKWGRPLPRWAEEKTQVRGQGPVRNGGCPGPLGRCSHGQFGGPGGNVLSMEVRSPSPADLLGAARHESGGISLVVKSGFSRVRGGPSPIVSGGKPFERGPENSAR